MTQNKNISNHKNSFVGIFLCSFYLNLAVQTSYRRAILRYESSTLIVYKELSSSIFQSCLLGMRDALPNLHFLQYIKA